MSNKIKVRKSITAEWPLPWQKRFVLKGREGIGQIVNNIGHVSVPHRLPSQPAVIENVEIYSLSDARKPVATKTI